MDQQQPIEEEQSNISQSIKNIYSHFENIKGQVNDEFPYIPLKSTVLVFLGKFGHNFENFYALFERKQVIISKIYYKLVQIEKNGKISYLLNFPLILQYDDKNDYIAQDLCISKIYAEMAFRKMETCNFQLLSFYLINYYQINIQQLIGDDDKGKLDTVVQDSIFFFGTYYFKEHNFSFLRQQNENKWDYHQIKQSNGFIQYFSKNQQLITQNLSQNQILNEIFQSDNYIKVEQVISEDFINYGKMMTYLQKQYKNLKEQFNLDLQHFQKLLLYLQQMPIIKYNQNVIKEVEKFLKELKEGFNNVNPPLTDNASQIGKVYQLICTVNNGQNAQNINTRQQNVWSSEMDQFLEDNKLKQLRIEPLLSNEQIDKLNRIIQFFQKYHNNELKNDKICEVQKLKLNLKQWSSYFKEGLENSLYDLKYIAQRIQKGPEIEMENGIYFIGITRVGKSTIINSLLNPDNIVYNEFLTQECYGIKMETKFAIGEGGVSETQKISGVYIGKKEKLNQIFQQEEEQSVFSLDEILDKDQIQKCKIPQNWFIFDCPGFGDDCNELMGIAHRRSLYNFFSKTKNIILFFVIDISSNQIDYIRNTFDPILCLLEDKNTLKVRFEEWANLILTKAKKGQKQLYLDNWDKVYRNYLDQNYSFYKKLFENDNRCIEFPKPSKQISDDIKKLTESIIKTSQNQLENTQRIIPKFQPFLDFKVQMLYQSCLSNAKLKFECIISFFLEDLEDYILESDDNIYQKKEQIEKIKNSIFNQSSNYMINVITQDNCRLILQALSNWIKNNNYLKMKGFFLQLYIQDIESIFEISKYCKNQNNLAPFEINIDNLFINKLILNGEQFILIYSGKQLNIIIIQKFELPIKRLQLSLIKLKIQLCIMEIANYSYEASITTVGTGSVSAGTSLLSLGFIDSCKNAYLRKIYQCELNKQKQQL